MDKVKAPPIKKQLTMKSAQSKSIISTPVQRKVSEDLKNKMRAKFGAKRSTSNLTNKDLSKNEWKDTK